jgi:hypothetical protein
VLLLETGAGALIPLAVVTSSNPRAFCVPNDCNDELFSTVVTTPDALMLETVADELFPCLPIRVLLPSLFVFIAVRLRAVLMRGYRSSSVVSTLTGKADDGSLLSKDGRVLLL